MILRLVEWSSEKEVSDITECRPSYRKDGKFDDETQRFFERVIEAWAKYLADEIHDVALQAGEEQ